MGRSLREMCSAVPAGQNPDRGSVVRAATPVADALRNAGYSAYVVGGLVRDMHLQGVGVHELTATPDVDMTTDAPPAQIKQAVAPISDDLWTQGERFGTIGCRIGGVDFEITTHRADRYDPASRKPAVEFSSAIDSDLSRRDFTVNAMAISIPDGAVIDPFGGRDDLAARRLRTPTDPEVSFDDDPLRILRAARFIAGYRLEPAPELTAAAQRLVGRLDIVSAERVRAELDKLLTTVRPGDGLRFLADVGAWPWIAAELDDAAVRRLAPIIDATSHANADVQLLARRAGLFGDLDPDVLTRRLGALRYSNAVRRSMTAVLASRSVLAGGPLDAPSVRRCIAAARGHLDAVLVLERAENPRRATQVQHVLDDLGAAEDLSRMGPGLGGAEVMEILGVTSGPIIGLAHRELQRIRFDEGHLDTDDLRARLLSWAEGVR
jgi:poly(A) polymerase